MSHHTSHSGKQPTVKLVLQDVARPRTPSSPTAQAPTLERDSGAGDGAGVSAVPTHDDIAQRAYDIYVANDCRPGQCQQNWLQAEQDLHQRGAVACQAEHRKHEFFAPDAAGVE